MRFKQAAAAVCDIVRHPIVAGPTPEPAAGASGPTLGFPVYIALSVGLLSGGLLFPPYRQMDLFIAYGWVFVALTAVLLAGFLAFAALFLLIVVLFGAKAESDDDTAWSWPSLREVAGYLVVIAELSLLTVVLAGILRVAVPLSWLSHFASMVVNHFLMPLI